MTDTAKTPPEGDDIDLLLPWYATERLRPTDRARVADALARDPEFARRLALAEEELGATIAANEALPAPSGRVRDQLLARIGALEGTHRRPRGAGNAHLRRLIAFFESLSPRMAAFGAGLAALLILLQAGLLAGMLLRPGSSFETASHGETREKGSFALVTFVPSATAGQIVAVLDGEGMRIAEGPYPGGVFRVRLSTSLLQGQAMDDAVARLSRRADTVQLAIPAESN